MADTSRVSIRKPTIRVGQDDIEVTDPACLQPVSAEVITEVRVFNATAIVSFASFIHDGSGPPEARVCARLRIPLEVIAGVQTAIQRSLEDQDAARAKAN